MRHDLAASWIQVKSTDAPPEVTVEVAYDQDVDSEGLSFSGTLAGGAYDFEVVIDHYQDAPSDLETLDVTIAAE